MAGCNKRNGRQSALLTLPNLFAPAWTAGDGGTPVTAPIARSRLRGYICWRAVSPVPLPPVHRRPRSRPRPRAQPSHHLGCMSAADPSRRLAASPILAVGCKRRVRHAAAAVSPQPGASQWTACLSAPASPRCHVSVNDGRRVERRRRRAADAPANSLTECVAAAQGQDPGARSVPAV